MPDPADTHLLVFLTRHGSLGQWKSVGMLDRELAIYRALRPSLRAISLVSYGGRGEQAIAREAATGIEVVARGCAGRHWHRWWRDHVWLPARRRPVVLKSNQVLGGELPARLAKRHGLPFVARCGYLRSRFAQLESGTDSPQAADEIRAEGEVFRAATRVVVTTSAMRDDAATLHHIPHERFRVVPNYVETGRFRPLPDGPLRKRGLPAGGPLRLVSVGRLAPQKNLHVLLAAVQQAGAELTLVGEGEQRDDLQALATRIGARVTFAGAKPSADLPAVLQAHDAYIQASLYEGHPKALIEGLACGLPAIGTRVPGIDDLLEHRKTGLLCEPTADALAGAIRELADDGDLRASLGGAARAMCEREFSLERVRELELEVYRGIGPEEHA
ncbi:MAG: glycosyltransferase family 4 protein [Planctomycetota bacterium]